MQGDIGDFDLWVRKIPWQRKWQSTPVFLPGESHGQRSLAGVPGFARGSDTIEQLSTHPQLAQYCQPKQVWPLTFLLTLRSHFFFFFNLWYFTDKWLSTYFSLLIWFIFWMKSSKYMNKEKWCPHSFFRSLIYLGEKAAAICLWSLVLVSSQCLCSYRIGRSCWSS